MSDMLLANEPLANEPLIREGVFAFVLLAMALWEIVAKRRPQMIHRRQRWPSNLAIVVLDTLAVRLFFPLAAVGAALIAAEQGWGLFSLVSVPIWLAVVISVVISVVMLDVATTSSTASSMPLPGCGGCIACTMLIRSSMSPRGCASILWKS